MSEVPDTCANYAPPALPTYPALPTNPSNSLSHPTSRNAPAGERHGGVGESPQPDDLARVEAWLKLYIENHGRRFDRLAVSYEKAPLLLGDIATLVAKVRSLTDENERLTVERDALRYTAAQLKCACGPEHPEQNCPEHGDVRWYAAYLADLLGSYDEARAALAAEREKREALEARIAAALAEMVRINPYPDLNVDMFAEVRAALSGVAAEQDVADVVLPRMPKSRRVLGSVPLSGVTADTTEEQQ